MALVFTETMKIPPSYKWNRCIPIQSSIMVSWGEDLWDRWPGIVTEVSCPQKLYLIFDIPTYCISTSYPPRWQTLPTSLRAPTTSSSVKELKWANNFYIQTFFLIKLIEKCQKKSNHLILDWKRVCYQSSQTRQELYPKEEQQRRRDYTDDRIQV